MSNDNQVSAKDWGIYFSSSWNILPDWKLMAIDDEFSQENAASSLGPFEDLAMLSGWHFQFIKNHPKRFPQLNQLFDENKISTLEKLLMSAPNLKMVYTNSNSNSPLWLSELLHVSNTPTLGDTPPFDSELVALSETMRINERNARMEQQMNHTLRFYGADLFDHDLESHIIEWIASLKTNLQTTVNSRFVLDNTLQETGELIGLTRERVRQIEAKALKKFVETGFFKFLLAQILEQTEEVISLNKMAITNDWFHVSEKFQHLICSAIKKKHQFLNARVTIEDVVVGAFSDDEYDAAKKEVYRAARSQKIQKLDKNTLISQLGIPSRLPLQHLIDDVLESYHLIEVDQNGYVRPADQASLTRKAQHVLSSENKNTWTTNSLKHAVETRYPEEIPVSDSVLHNILMDQMEQIGRGTYARPFLLDLSDESATIVGNIIDTLLDTKRHDRQWHAYEIFEHMNERGLHRHIPHDEYSIYYFVKQRPEKYKALGRLVFAKNCGSDSPSERSEIHELAVKILRDARTPIQGSELIEKIKKVRGMGRNRQVHATGLIELNGFGQFYLNDYSQP